MLSFRFALESDIDLYFNWVNDALVRKNSLNTKKINLDDHVAWFTEKVKDPNVFMYLFLNEQQVSVGQVIIERKENWASVGQSVAKEHRGKRYSSEMLSKGTDDYLTKFPNDTIVSVVKSNNISSIKMSINSGFNVVNPNQDCDKMLVLKGSRQDDQGYIMKFKRFFKLGCRDQKP